MTKENAKWKEQKEKKEKKPTIEMNISKEKRKIQCEEYTYNFSSK